jgi:protein phosphatase
MTEKPSTEQPNILFAEECDRGNLREENLGYVFHAHIALGDLMIVADDVGGYMGGAAASRKVVDYFYVHLAALKASYPADKGIREATAYANAKILATTQTTGSPRQRVGSTVVVALVQPTADGMAAWIGHIGNSRAYLSRAGHLYLLTTDHSQAQSLLNSRLITPEEAENHPDALVLTRSLGDRPEVLIDIDQHPLGVGDTLLLCSDGLWGLVSDQKIRTIISTPDHSLEQIAHNLLELALEAGGFDNIGIEMAQLIAPPEVVLPPNKSPNRVRSWILRLFILAFAGLCVLAYFIFVH